MRWECAECGGISRGSEPPLVCPVCGIGGQCYPAGSGLVPAPLGLDGFRGAWLEQGLGWPGTRRRSIDPAVSWPG